jgi:hypothetical protein
MLEQTDFIVKQSKLINGLLSVFFLLLVIGLMFTFSADHEHSIGLYVKPLAVVIAFIIISVVNSRRRREIYRINNTGIFYNSKLITTWEAFHIAFVNDDSNFTSVNDDIRLVVQYYNDQGQLSEMRLPAPPTLDRSVYEIIEAIIMFQQTSLSPS